MIHVRGMYGVGDCIHQRAVLRELVKLDRDVVLETPSVAQFHDMLGVVRVRRLPNIQPRMRERHYQTDQSRGAVEPGSPLMRARITYGAEMIHRHGSILGAQFAACNIRMPAQPDFSLNVPERWRRDAGALLTSRRKPLMVYRPIVLNDVWRAPARAPDPELYAALYASIRDRYHVVSVADLGSRGEGVLGEPADVDQRFERGELDFETVAGLFAEADLVFACPGFSAVLGQAVGTPTVITYGANECHRTTNSVGDHLAPTLAIEPTVPCSCHVKSCACSKKFDLEPVIPRLRNFTCAF